jgi:transposase
MVGCLAYARRKFHEPWTSHGSQVGEKALKFFGQLYRWPSKRQKVSDGSATAKGIDYSLNRWAALTRHIDDGARC